jgi:signal transduction histidine kinase
MSNSHSLKWKAVAGVTVLTVTVIVLVSAIQMHFMRQDVTRLLADQHFSVVSNMAKELDGKLESYRNVIAGLANGFPSELLASPEATRNWLRPRPALLVQYDDVLALTPDGKLIADHPGSHEHALEVVADPVALEKLRTTLKPAISSLVTDGTPEGSSIQFMAPVLDKDKHLAGVLLAVLKLQNKFLLADLAKAKIGKSGIFLLLTKESTPRYLVHPDKDMFLKPRPPGAASAVTRALAGSEGTAEDLNSAGVHGLYAYKSLKMVDWLLIAFVPVDDAFALIKESEHRLWLICVAVGLVVVPCVWLFAWLMLTPLSALRDNVEKLRDSASAAAAVPVDGNDEIGDLARSFNVLLRERASAAASQRAAEQKLRSIAEDAARELEVNVERRTADLRVINQELESFSYSVAHDLRAPLRAIGGFSALVLGRNEGKLDATSGGHLQRIKFNAERMAELIDDLLNMTRVSRQQMHRVDFDMSAVAQGIAKELAEAHPQRTVETVIQPAMQVNADPGLIRVLLQNLLENAWKFTAGKEPARIEIGCETQGSESVYFVRDNGAGFDMTYVNKLFSPFQRLHGQTEFEGTGIGLSIVRRVAMKHGGGVHAEGSVGEGATFYFTLGTAPA